MPKKARSERGLAYQRLYKTARWQALREHRLVLHPLCERCFSEGRIVRATVAHHRVAHHGNEALFFDPANLASSCKPCHDSAEQSTERLGFSKQIGSDGWPVDPNHPFNQTGGS